MVWIGFFRSCGLDSWESSDCFVFVSPSVGSQVSKMAGEIARYMLVAVFPIGNQHGWNIISNSSGYFAYWSCLGCVVTLL